MLDLDFDHSAHRAFLNSRIARDRLIVSNSFFVVVVVVNRVPSAVCHLCWIRCDFIIVLIVHYPPPPGNTYFRQNLRQNGDVSLDYCMAKGHWVRYRPISSYKTAFRVRWAAKYFQLQLSNCGPDRPWQPSYRRCHSQLHHSYRQSQCPFLSCTDGKRTVLTVVDVAA